MPFQISPGVNVSEIDLTTVVPAVATTEGAIAGVFSWGPVNERVLVGSEVELVRTFGRPTDDNFKTFFTAANFLAYADALYVVRVASNTAVTASANSDYFEAAYPGTLGNSISVAYVDAEGWESANSGSDTIVIEAGASSGVIEGSNTYATDIEAGDVLTLSNGQQLVVASAVANTVTTTEGTGNTAVTITTELTELTFENRYIGATSVNTTFTFDWGYKDQFINPPSANSLHVVVYDNDGGITGTKGTIIEKYEDLSTDQNAKYYDGSTRFVDDALEFRSNWIRRSNTAISFSNPLSEYIDMTGGTNGDAEDDETLLDELVKGYDLFQTPDEVDISLVLAGNPREIALTNYIIDNVVEKRRDCVLFVSPKTTSVSSYDAQDLVDAVNGLNSSSYMVVDTGYRYQYDKYNDKYRWTPLNGDIAGLCARTDDQRDPWYSPAGYNRGFVKNVVKLALNPTKAERDLLYKSGINPVITQGGQGTLLFGDKTYLNQPSAFDRINVRRLFIVLEKAIAIASKRSLFEFNDEFTRAQFRNLVEPYLRDVQGRRGIYDFRVVCDATNNTPEVIDRNEFIGDIYIKPARSINFIQLNFIAVRTGVEFSEIVGRAT